MDCLKYFSDKWKKAAPFHDTDMNEFDSFRVQKKLDLWIWSLKLTGCLFTTSSSSSIQTGEFLLICKAYSVVCVHIRTDSCKWIIFMWECVCALHFAVSSPCVCVHPLRSSQETCNLKRWDGGISSPHAVAGDWDTWASWPQTISEREWEEGEY